MDKFKPVRNEKTITSIRLDISLLDKIDEIAGKTNLSRNELIIQCLEFSIRHYSQE